ncbi:MAG: tRNA (guanosine(46)-N7)-methyltransferase TrmB [Fuerstiella sp.]|nr:tRNA (guanosine(46)-N7)-methyltransferase TrmB [Fuerstiella sp.]
MQTAPIKPLKPWFQVIDDVGASIVWSEFFGNDNPVELDIGCGRGLFLYTAAQNNPDINYLGLEIDYREGRRTAERLKKQQMQNARVIGGDGNIVLTKMIEKYSVSAAHVYFPDPWWKKRHHKRRIFTQQFTEILSDVIQPEGHVHSWSDVAEYFEIIKSLMDGQPNFETLPPPEARDPEHDMDYQTSFHRKKSKLGLPIYRGLWQRKAITS